MSERRLKKLSVEYQTFAWEVNKETVNYGSNIHADGRLARKRKKKSVAGISKGKRDTTQTTVTLKVI